MVNSVQMKALIQEYRCASNIMTSLEVMYTVPLNNRWNVKKKWKRKDKKETKTNDITKSYKEQASRVEAEI